jgi:DNA-binding NarL/FixJ family response regulator
VVVYAVVSDLMDRSRISAAVPGARFVRRGDECAGADVIVIDLRAGADAITTARNAVPSARIVAFGPHVDHAALAEALAAGADTALPRSRFFADVSAALADST